ncbi:hypothetical protein D3C80_1889720 [compost metagenome]
MLHGHTLRIAVLLFAELICIDDFADMLFCKLVLALTLRKVLRRIDEENIIRFLTLLQHKYADGDAGRIEQVRGKADDCIYVTVLQELCADAFLRPTSEQHAMW